MASNDDSSSESDLGGTGENPMFDLLFLVDATAMPLRKYQDYNDSPMTVVTSSVIHLADTTWRNRSWDLGGSFGWVLSVFLPRKYDIPTYHGFSAL
jgi:hypothetical protein